MANLIEVSNLQTQFFTQDGIVHAVNGISYEVAEGETVAIVGESGSGKSVGVMSLIRLIPEPPGKIVNGEVVFDGQDLLQLNEEELRQIRGNRIAMIFQDPMMIVEPGSDASTRQMIEALDLHHDHHEPTRRAAPSAAATRWNMVGIPDRPTSQAERSYPHQFSGGMRQRVAIAIALSCTTRN